MLPGSMFAGQAFANSPAAAVHAPAYPIGGWFHIPHGLSNALVPAHVLRFNAPYAAAQYADLARDAMKQTRLLVNNPREVAEADALAIYRAAY